MSGRTRAPQNDSLGQCTLDNPTGLAPQTFLSAPPDNSFAMSALPTMGPAIGPSIGPAIGPSIGPAAATPVAPAAGGPSLLETISNVGNAATSVPSQFLQARTGEAARLGGYIPTNASFMQNGMGAVNNSATRNLGALGFGAGLLQAPTQAGKLFAGDSSTSDRLGAASNLTGTAKSGLETAGMFGDLHRARGAATTAMTAAAPNASRSVIGAGANAAADLALTRGTNVAGVTNAVRGAAGEGSTLARALGVGNRAAGQGAVRAGVSGAAHAGASTLGKAAARFAPGLNVAIAAMDTANFAATMMDDKASTGKKVFSGLTAAGSIAAATNIPIVSQIGAGVSAVSGLIGSFF